LALFLCFYVFIFEKANVGLKKHSPLGISPSEKEICDIGKMGLTNVSLVCYPDSEGVGKDE
jgi:hypothetical protein